MKLFATLFTAISLILIPSAYANETSLEETKGRAQMEQVQNDYREVITGDFGGSVLEYIQKYNKLRQQGAKLRIDDLCMSACTLVLGLVPKENVCVSPFAQLAFHSAWAMTFSGPAFAKEGTRLIWSIYPEEVREKLRANGWDGGEHPDFIYFKATDFYELCN